MSELFPYTKIDLKDLFLEIKYDGPSFDGVMDIQDLGNELLGIEYCLTKIINDLVKSTECLSQDDITSLQILTEGFVDNCFKKKIKFYLDEVEKRPVLISVLALALTTYLNTNLIQISINNANTQTMIRSNQIPLEQHKKIIDLPISDKAKKIIKNNILDKKYREASLKAIVPLKNDSDVLESSSLNTSVLIDNSNKKGFFITGLETELEDLSVQEGYLTIRGRIHRINLDATKNHIGFKIDNEGNEIHCHLSEQLDINDYKDKYLGEYVEITGTIYKTQMGIKEIEILKITKKNPHGQGMFPYE